MMYFSEFIQELIRYSSIPIYSPGFKALASIVLRYLADKISSIFFQWAIILERGTILTGEKNMCQLFFHEESIYEISKP